MRLNGVRGDFDCGIRKGLVGWPYKTMLSGTDDLSHIGHELPIMEPC